jgi:hypothetical protein
MLMCECTRVCKHLSVRVCVCVCVWMRVRVYGVRVKPPLVAHATRQQRKAFVKASDLSDKPALLNGIHLILLLRRRRMLIASTHHFNCSTARVGAQRTHRPSQKLFTARKLFAPAARVGVHIEFA